MQVPRDFASDAKGSASRTCCKSVHESQLLEQQRKMLCISATSLQIATKVLRLCTSLFFARVQRTLQGLFKVLCELFFPSL
jgi:hypothetical protein